MESVEDDLYYDGVYSTSPPPKPDKKEQAERIYNQLIVDDELMYELNVMLRKHKLKNIKK